MTTATAAKTVDMGGIGRHEIELGDDFVVVRCEIMGRIHDFEFGRSQFSEAMGELRGLARRAELRNEEDASLKIIRHLDWFDYQLSHPIHGCHLTFFPTLPEEVLYA